MPLGQSQVDLVRKLVMQLPDVEESTIHGAPSWKLNGRLLTCPAIHKSAEPNSLLVKIELAKREELLSTDPETYYVTEHYESDAAILVRLSRIDQASLEELLMRAWHFVSARRAKGKRQAMPSNASKRGKPPKHQ